jgi:hypothetical protein
MSTPVPPEPGQKRAWPPYVIMKSGEVNLDGVDEKLIEFLTVLGNVHQALWGCPLIVTSARDQIHVAGSKHGQGKAVDIRVNDIEIQARDRLLAVVNVLADRFQLTVFDERNLPGAGHFHVEVAG